jgi:hypothetical protein
MSALAPGDLVYAAANPHRVGLVRKVHPPMANGLVMVDVELIQGGMYLAGEFDLRWVDDLLGEMQHKYERWLSIRARAELRFGLPPRVYPAP